MSPSGTLLVPILSAAGEIQNLQVIARDGQKRFLKGGATRGYGYQIGTGEVLVFAEGVATALSIHQTTNLAVVIAFSADNLEAVALALRSTSSSKFIFAADNDESGMGERKAKEAATATDGVVVMPKHVGMDFNDLQIEYGGQMLLDEFSDWVGSGASKSDEASDLVMNDGLTSSSKLQGDRQ